MCVYGVTRIGTGSLGASRFLPPLLEALQLTKPGLVFLSGAWGALYLLNRQTFTAPLTGRVLSVLLLVTALLGTGDAAAELAYLAIPKKEDLLDRGCCTVPFDSASDASALQPAPALLGAGQEHRLWFHYYAINIGMILALGGAALLGRRLRPIWLVPLLLYSVLSVAVSAVFLVEVAAPRLLRLPYHHCPYDLIPKAPESLVAIALYLFGAFAVGWAGVVAWLGVGPEARPLVPGMVQRFLRLALLGYLGSLVMTSVELALA